jgi:hypothetical protein
MTVDVLVTRTADHRYVARALALPYVSASGASEAEAIEALRHAHADVQARSHIVQVELPTLQASNANPWVRFAGIWRDDPDWDVFQNEVDAYRCLSSFNNNDTQS